jgi:hypothetical protein
MSQTLSQPKNDWLIQFRIDRLSFTVAFIVLKPEDLAVKRLVVKQYDFLLGAALFLWQQLMALMGCSHPMSQTLSQPKTMSQP